MIPGRVSKHFFFRHPPMGLQISIFPFRAELVTGGGGCKSKKSACTPPHKRGGVRPPRRGVKGPPLGGCRNTNKKNHNEKNQKNWRTVTPPLWGVKARGGVPKFTGVHGPPLGGSRNIPARLPSASFSACSWWYSTQLGG